MPYFVKLPTYRCAPGVDRYINIVNGISTSGQRQLRRTGFGDYEVDTAATLCALLERRGDSSVFFDVGSNVGHYSFLCKGLWPDAEVVAFEPTPKTCLWLTRISDANRHGIKAENVAVGAKEGEVVFYHSSKSDSSNSLNADFREHLAEQRVKCITLDGYCKEHNIQPNVIKIDTETVEEQVLLGAEQLLRTSKPALVVEVLDAAGSGAAQRITEFVRSLGLHIYRINGDAALRPSDTITGVGGAFLNWLIVPERLDDTFHDALNVWRTRLEECRAPTNVTARRTAGVEPQAAIPFLENALAAAEKSDDAVVTSSLQAAMQEGSITAHYTLGRYAETHGDFTTSLQQFRAGAKLHEVAAIRGVARAYQLGRGIPIDIVEAKLWLEKAAGLSDRKAAELLLEIEATEREKAAH